MCSCEGVCVLACVVVGGSTWHARARARTHARTHARPRVHVRDLQICTDEFGGERLHLRLTLGELVGVAGLLRRLALPLPLLEELVQREEALGLAVQGVDIRGEGLLERAAAAKLDRVLPLVERDGLLARRDLSFREAESG